MAILTISDIDYGVIFGPVNVESPAMNPTRLIGLMTEDTRCEKNDSCLSVDLLEMSKRTRALEWLICIPSARNEEEQNMEAYTKGGKVYYRTLRIIKAGEPLFVWYSKDFCHVLHIQDIKRQANQESEQLVCNKCGEVFQHEFPLMAHIRFKCEESAHSDLENNIRKELESLKSKLKEIAKGLRLDMNVMSSKNINATLKRDFNNVQNTQSEPSIKLRRLSSDTVMNTYSDASAFRKFETENRSFCTSPSILSSFSGKRFKVSETSSAVNLCLYGFNFPGVQTTPITSVMSNACQNSSGQLPHMPLSQQVSQNRAVNASMSLASDPWKQYFISERLNAGIPYMKRSNPMVDKILQNTSPVVVNSPVNATALSQNWCAKCNASFRMTSDLVYHMRSHHKREFDPVKKKRDDKLKCNICQETFRERHHLTRHMTSHI